MAFCDLRTWQMTLRFDDQADPETLDFVLETGGVGRVNVSNVRMSNLRWTCVTHGQFGQPDAKALFRFVFRFRRQGKEFGVMMAGFAHLISTTVRFRGGFRTFNLDNRVPQPGTAELQILTLGEPGDTGTGTGTQT
jgi:hypothetical protein